MKFITVTLFLVVTLTAVSALTRTKSGNSKPLLDAFNALKLASHARTVELKPGNSILDYIGDLIDWLRTRDWNHIIDELDEALRDCKGHVERGIEEVKALELSNEVVDAIVAKLPGWVSDYARPLTPDVISIVKLIITWGEEWDASDPIVAVVCGALVVYAYGIFLPFVMLPPVVELVNEMAPGMGDKLDDIFFRALVDLEFDIYEFVQSFWDH